MNGGGLTFAVENLHFLCPLLIYPAVKPFCMYRFRVHFKAITVNGSPVCKGGFHSSGLFDRSRIQAEILYVDGFTDLAVLERVHDEMLVEGNGLQHIGFTGSICSVYHGTANQRYSCS